MMPYISVIVPVYNAESTLKKCIDSILVQDFTDFEVILIDDGSQDESLQICEDFAKKDNRVIVVHKENGGVSSARNYGLEIAKGKWVTFIDSDDYVDDELLEKVNDAIEKNAGVDVVGYNLVDVDESGNIMYSPFALSTP